MAKSFIFNMGYDISHVTSVLANEGLDDGSRVVLVKPGRRDERQENSIEDIRNHLNSLDVDVSLDVFPSGESFEQDVENFLDLYSRFENVVLSLSGGSRDLLIPMTVASVFSGEIDETYFRSDIDSDLQKMQIPHANFDLNDSEQEILDALGKGSESVQGIIDVTDLSRSTVYRRLGALEEKEIVEEKEEGYRKTLTGEIIS